MLTMPTTISSGSAYALVCCTPTLKDIYAEGYREYRKVDLPVKTLMYKVGSAELLAYTLGHVAAEKDATYNENHVIA
jgi:hypothetical protein